MAAQDPVVICGAGVIGCAIAYELSARDVPVLVVEAERVAYGASGTAAGLLSPPSLALLRSPLGPMLRASFDRHLQLASTLPAESRIDYGFARHPQLRLARTAGEERALRDELARRSHIPRASRTEPVQSDFEESTERLGSVRPERSRRKRTDPPRWLDPSQVLDQLPWLDADAEAGPLRGALLGELAAQIEPDRFTQALLSAACRRGAVLRSGRVQGIVRERDHASAVLVDGEPVPASAVVIAMGPWSAAAASWLGTPVPVEPLKGQIVRLDPARDLPLGGFVDANDDYAAVKASGLVYLGTTEESVGFDLTPTPQARESILRFGRRHSSLLAAATIVEQTACLRPLSADSLPIIGPVPGLSGSFLATGHGRKGLLLAPATGLALAELITQGRSTAVDLRPFDPARFAPAGG